MRLSRSRVIEYEPVWIFDLGEPSVKFIVRRTEKIRKGRCKWTGKSGFFIFPPRFNFGDSNFQVCVPVIQIK